jgi:hypothetical protein
VIGIAAAIYVVWNTLMAFITSRLMGLDRGTFGHALGFTIMTAILGVCMSILEWLLAGGFVGWMALVGLSEQGEETAVAVMILSSLAFFVLWQLLAILVAAWVYRIGLLKAFAFLIALSVVNAIALIMAFVGCVGIAALSSGALST